MAAELVRAAKSESKGKPERLRTVDDINIDSFEDKPLRHPGVLESDFFNFGLNKEKWKDLPVELAAAAGLHDAPAESAQFRKMDIGKRCLRSKGIEAISELPPAETYENVRAFFLGIPLL